ncbi:SURF1 family protein [Nocardioides sp. SYSU D00038]|uniref:SURF1 family protein n=1 Tax=Nocardioides sp. SYSU D00038 TaxID=2812554 RepID=UPI0019671492|nr:SURF1 family protein [Nocardioides sp. SYSU D00038]
MSGALHPRLWGAHVVAIAAVGLAGLLGWWQLESWHERREAEARDLTEQPAVLLEDVMGPDDPFPADQVGQPVEIVGTWVPDGTVHVANREREGLDGFWQVTPLAVGTPDGPAVPVVTGWFPVVESPTPPPPTGATTITAWLQPTEGTGEVDPDPTDDVVPQLRTADVIQHVDQDLYGAYAVARQPLGGLAAVTPDQLPEVGTFTALRNLLYALEWWVFAAFAGFIWWRYVRDVTRPAPLDEEAAEDDEDHPVASQA